MFLLRNPGFFGVKKHIVPGQVATEKNERKIRRNLRKSWLAILDEIREKDRENVLSQTKALKQLDWSEIDSLIKVF